MRKRRVYAVVVGVGVLVGLLVWGFGREREPEYGGKRLSEWVEGFLGASADGKQQTREAIGHIGTNALPYLVKWLGCDMSPWKRKFYSIRNPAIMPVRACWRLFDKRDDKLQFGAWRALLDLGPRAEGAIGDLSRLANGTKQYNSRDYAIVILGEIGKAGFRTLVGVLTNQQAQGGKWTPDSSITIAHYIGKNAWMDRDIARLAIPALLSMRKDPDPKISAAATDALQDIDPQALERATR